MATSAKSITYENSLAMPENRLEEIVGGESRIMPPPTDRHALLVQSLADDLRSQLDRKEFIVFTTSFGLAIEREPVLTYRVPDVAVFRRSTLRQDRLEKRGNDPYIWKAPDLVVECLSPSNRKGPVDELLRDYARIAIPEVWVLQPQERILASHARQGETLAEVRRVTNGVVSPIHFPDVRINLEALWRVFHRDDLP